MEKAILLFFLLATKCEHDCFKTYSNKELDFWKGLIGIYILFFNFRSIYNLPQALSLGKK